MTYKPTYLQLLQQQQGESLTAESALQKVNELRTSAPHEALKYFLEVGDLFRPTGQYDTTLKVQACTTKRNPNQKGSGGK